MNEKQLHDKLKSSGIAGVGELDEATVDPFVVVETDAIVEVATFLRDDPDCAMEMLHLVTATERADCIEIAYHLCSMSRHHSLTVKTSVARPEGDGEWIPEVPSIAGVYSSANWHEREQWDLLGVRFTAHPDLRRILLPEEWIGHPLRKDYVYPSEHGGMPLELDAVPLYERDGAEPPAARSEPRPAGTPLEQPPSAPSTRPDAGGRAPAKEGES
jgi:NADH-quinone oxidoreductase subunit C